MKVEITRATMGDLSNLAGEADNVDIVFTDDILEYTSEDFQRYQTELFKIADRIITSFTRNNHRVAVNVLTDIFSLKPAEKHEYLLFCKHCPCFHCKPDPDLFKKATGDSFIPPRQYCEKAFVELGVSRYIIDRLKLDYDISDIDRILFDEYVDLLYGTNLGR